MNQKQKGLLAAFIGNVIFGLSFLFSSVVFSIGADCFYGADTLKGADVPAVLAIRFTMAFVLMTVIMPLFHIKLQLRGKPVWKLILLGVFQPVIYFIGESFGIKMTDAIVSSVVIGTVPVVAQIFSTVFLKERPTVAQVLFCLLSIFGVGLITVFSGGENQKTYMIGIFCLLIAVISAVAFNAMGRENSKVFTPFEQTYMMFVVAAVFFWTYALIAAKGNVPLILSPLKEPSFILSILYLGGLSSVGAYFMINYANTYLPITQTTAFTNLIPVISTIAGFIINHNFDWMISICCAVIVIGVWGVQNYTKKETA